LAVLQPIIVIYSVYTPSYSVCIFVALTTDALLYFWLLTDDGILPVIH